MSTKWDVRTNTTPSKNDGRFPKYMVVRTDDNGIQHVQTFDDGFQLCLIHMRDLVRTRTHCDRTQVVISSDIMNIAFIRMSVAQRPDADDFEITNLDLIQAIFAACSEHNAPVSTSDMNDPNPATFSLD